MTLPIINYFDHKGTVGVSVLRDTSVGIFEHLGIKYWDIISKRWMYFEKFLRALALKKFRNVVLSCRDISKDNSENLWNLGEPENVVLDDFWYLCKVDELDCNGDVITNKDLWIDLDCSLWFMLGRSMWKNISVCLTDT